jgi:hypothetical protein
MKQICMKMPLLLLFILYIQVCKLCLKPGYDDWGFSLFFQSLQVNIWIISKKWPLWIGRNVGNISFCIFHVSISTFLRRYWDNPGNIYDTSRYSKRVASSRMFMGTIVPPTLFVAFCFIAFLLIDFMQHFRVTQLTPLWTNNIPVTCWHSDQFTCQNHVEESLLTYCYI